MTRLGDRHAAWKHLNPSTPRYISTPRLRVAVESWWRGRLEDGCQLSNPSALKEWYDWRGKDRWKNGVTVDAMWGDFIWVTGLHVPKLRFWAAAHPLMGHTRNRVKMARFLKGDGSLFLRPRRSFVMFRTLEEHRNAFPGRHT